MSSVWRATWKAEENWKAAAILIEEEPDRPAGDIWDWNPSTYCYPCRKKAVVRKPKKTAQNTAPIDVQQSCVWLLVSVAEVCFLPMLLLLTSLQHDYPWYCYHIESFGQYGSDMQSLYATGHLKNHREHIKNNCKCANYKQVCYRFAQPIGKATGKADSSQLAELHIPTGGQVSIIIIYTQNNCL